MKFIKYAQQRLKNDKPTGVLFIVYILISIFSMFHWLLLAHIRNALMAILAMILIPAILLVEYYLHIEFGYGFIVCVMIICFGGLQLGPGYDLYMKFPNFDEVLHILSGFMFCSLGFILSKHFICDNKLYVHIAVGIMFSLTLGLLWEMFEYAGSSIFGIDMQEDSIVDYIRSYYLSNSHNDITIIEGITETIIKYGDNQELIISGYLDIGLYDTLNDMLVCLIGTVIYSVMMIFDKEKKLNEFFCMKSIEY